MRVQLKEFQADAVDGLLSTLDNMRDMYVRNGMHSAVSLTAPTGSGKTVMSAAVIESLFFGNADTGQLGDDKALRLVLQNRIPRPALACPFSGKSHADAREKRPKLPIFAHCRGKRNAFGLVLQD